MKIDWALVYWLSLTGFLLLMGATIAHGGTIFDANGNKIGTCKGSTCTPSGNGGTDGATPTPTRNVAKSKAKAKASSRSTSRSASSSAATAKGGSATAIGGTVTTTATSSPSQTTSVSVQSGSTGGGNYGDIVPDVYAPALVTGGDDVCMGSTSLGGSGSGLGLLFGTTWKDEHCQTIKAVKLLVTMSRPDAAIRRACMDDKMREALGDECPARKQEPQPSNSSTFIH